MNLFSHWIFNSQYDINKNPKGLFLALAPHTLFDWTIFQWNRSPGKEGSHFNPNSNLFSPSERKDVITSTLCWAIMLSVLLYFSLTMGPLFMFKLYGVPYLVISLWQTLNLYIIIIRLTHVKWSFTYLNMCRSSSCGWISSHTCIIMVTSRNCLGTEAR